MVQEIKFPISLRIGSVLFGKIPFMKYLRASVLFRLFLVFVALGYTSSAHAQIEITLGGHQTVIDAGVRGLNYFPDEPISIISNRPSAYLVVSGQKTILMQGQTFETARPVRDVLVPGQAGEFDSGYAGITSIIKKEGQMIALYHAEDHVGGQISYSTINRAYWSIGLATADIKDQGFAKQGQILTASVSKEKMKPTDDHLGLGDATIIEEASGEYYYAYFTDLTRKPTNPAATIGMARCTVASGGARGAWKKFHNGRFEEPGLGGIESPVVRPLSAFPCDVFAPHVAYLRSAKKYVMTCNVMVYSDHEKQEAEHGGIYYAVSDNGIQWSEPKQLVVGHPVPYVGRVYIGHPRLLIEREDKKQAIGWLLYCYSESWGTESPNKPHYLCRRRVQIKLAE